MIRQTFHLAIIVLFALTSSQASMAQEAEEFDKEEGIRELIRVTGGDEIANVMMAEMMIQMESLLRQMHPDLPDDVMAMLMEEMRVSFDATEFVDLTIPIYDRHFTDEDIIGMLEFYRTPLGMRMIEVLPAIMQESMVIGQEWGERAGLQAANRVIARLKAEGFAVD